MSRITAISCEIRAALRAPPVVLTLCVFGGGFAIVWAAATRRFALAFGLVAAAFVADFV
jgi:hypothetical protein